MCDIDQVTGWCGGCRRTLDEIAIWSALSSDAKRLMIADLARRVS